MKIENKLREIAEKYFANFSYIFENWDGADRALEYAAYPAIVCLLPVGGKLILSPHGLVKDGEDIAIAFIDKVDRDADGYDNEAVYTRMKKAAANFISAISKDTYFAPIEGDVKYSTIYEAGAAIHTGVFVELNLKERTGVCL